MNDKITRQYELCLGILTKTSEGKAYYTIEMWHAYKQELGLNAIRWTRLAVDVDWWKEKFKSLKDFVNDHFRGLTKMVSHCKVFHEFAKRRKNIVAIHKVIALCKALTVNADYHFRELTKMIMKRECKAKNDKSCAALLYDLLDKNSTFLNREVPSIMKFTVMYDGKNNAG